MIQSGLELTLNTKCRVKSDVGRRVCECLMADQDFVGYVWREVGGGRSCEPQLPPGALLSDNVPVKYRRTGHGWFASRLQRFFERRDCSSNCLQDPNHGKVRLRAVVC